MKDILSEFFFIFVELKWKKMMSRFKIFEKNDRNCVFFTFKSVIPLKGWLKIDASSDEIDLKNKNFYIL